ncbi:DNA replication regulator sld2 [Orbilia blumenaviensis]|uniref:DNA replication regulator SLD2 n=1 Tax=Orbilia blumenaviensis TaxID=1796055 RepID=A0AAV9VH02_9PEZI
MANHPDVTLKSDSDRLLHLKLKIKAWEKDFAAQNDGKPPSRRDISANPKIAARYSEYQKLKKQLGQENSQTTVSKPISQPARKQPVLTPRKPSGRLSQTPVKTPSNPFVFTPTNRSELQGSLYSPSASAIRQLKWMAKGYVSPTPQKNGKVLGLFDKLPGMTPTPPKRPRDAEDSAILAKSTDSAARSKIFHSSGFDDSDEDDAYIPLDPTTPSRKRRYEFQTPLSKKNKRNASDEPDPFSTPAIFRQHSIKFELKENGSPLTPEVKQFLPNRMIGKVKPLSTLVRELREMQEEEDPGMEVLRALERGETNSTKATDLDKSELAAIPLHVESENQDGNLEADNQPKPPVYKKKGLKRQTKRVKIRPVRVTRTKSNTKESSPESESESESEEATNRGTETHNETTKPDSENEGSNDEDHDERTEEVEKEAEESETGEVSEDELASIVPKATSKKKPTKTKTPAAAKSAITQKKTTVKADKHANYTRMKMHHKGRGFKGRGRGRR